MGDVLANSGCFFCCFSCCNRFNPSSKHALSTSTRDRPTRNCRSPRTRSSTFSMPLTQTGFLSGTRETMALCLRIISSWEKALVVRR